MSDTAVADGLAMGKRVQERRGEMNLTLGMLSEKTGITTQQLANLETGLYPDFFKLPDIAKALNTTVDYLKTGKGVGASYTDINTSIELGAFVRYLRMKQGLTQTQLGERIGQDYGSEISKMERGLSTLPIRNKADRLGPALAFSAENLRNIADRVLLAERDPVLPRAAPSPRQAQAIPDSTVPGDVIAAIREEGRLTRELLTKQHEQLLQIIRAMPGSDLAAALHTLIDNLLKKR